MSGELTRRTSSAAAARQHVQDVDAVLRRVELVQLEVAGIGRVTRCALQEALYTNLARKQAESLAPDGAEQYALIAWQGTMAMARRIDEMGSAW